MRRKYVLWSLAMSLILTIVVYQQEPEKALAYAPELQWQEVYASGVNFQDIDRVLWADNKFVAIGDGGRVLTSPDGVVWTRQTSNTTQDLNDMIYVNGRFVAVGYGGAVITSTNGVDWSAQTLESQYEDENFGLQYFLTDVLWDGARYIVKSTYSAIFVSTDLITWSESQVPRGNRIIHANNALYMVGSTGALDPHAFVIRSTDGGTTWTTVYEDAPGVLYSLVYANGRFIASGRSAENGSFVYTGLLVTSIDGVNWTSQYLPGRLSPKNIQWVNNEFILSAARVDENQSTLFYSADGQAWTEHNTGFGLGAIHSVAYGPGYYVAVGFNYNTPAFFRSAIAPLDSMAAVGTTSSQVTLEWTQPAGAGDVRLEYKQSSGNIASWAEVDTVADVTASSTGATVTGLLPGTDYDFRLLAVGGANDGYSNVARAKTDPVPVDDLSVVSTDSTEVGLTWSAAPFATAISVQQSTDNGGSWATASTTAHVTASATSATVRSLTPGTAYMFRVVVTGGQKEGESNEASTTTPYMQVNNLFSNPYTGSTSTTVTLTWTAATNAASIVLEQSANGSDGWTAATVSGGSISPDGTTATVTGLTPNTTYYYRLSINGGYHHGYSNQFAATTKAALITDLASTADKRTAIFTWTPVSDATSAVFEYRNNSTGLWHAFDWATDIDMSTGTYTTDEGDLSLYVNYYIRLNVTGGHSAGTSNAIYAMLSHLDVDFQNTSYGSSSATFQWPEYFDSSTMVTVLQQRTITYKQSSGSTWIDGTMSWNALTGTVNGLTPNTSYDFALLAKYGTSRLMSDIVTLTTRQAYTLSYATDGNGSITGVASQTVVHGGDGTTVTAVPADGYTFLQWSDDVDTASRTDTDVQANVEVIAQFVPDTVDVTYEYNDGSAPTVEQRPFGSLLPEPDKPAREGYVLTGWYTDIGLTQAWDFDTDTVSMGGVMLYAKWAVAYTVVFLDWDGETLATEIVEQGTTATAPAADPERIGHAFNGWDRSFDAVLENIYVTAQYTVNTYTIYFDSQGGSSVAEVEADYDTVIDAPEAPELDGYQFDGWYTDIGLTQAWDFAVDRMPVDGITLYAGWLETYPVVFVDWNGAVLHSEIVVHNGSATAPVVPLRLGYTFASWNQPFANVTETLIVQAVYTPNEYDIGYVYNDGSPVTVTQATYGEHLTEPPTPTRDGHLFIGWYRDAELTEAWNFDTDTVPIDGVVLYADWINTYPVVFIDWNGAVLHSEIVVRNGAAAAPANPERVGHTFTGWSQTFTGITAATNVQALYTINSYEVRYEYNDGSPQTVVQATYFSHLTAPAAPERDGYLLVGWYKDAGLTQEWDFSADRMPADSVMLYAEWALAYPVAFVDWNGTVLKSEIVRLGADASPPTTPVRLGHTFVGWNSSYTNVASELAITATYTVNAYSIYFDSRGGSDVDALEADYNTTIEAPAAPTRRGYRFNGWYNNEGLTQLWNFDVDTVPVDGITLYARWSRIEEPVGQTGDNDAGMDGEAENESAMAHEILVNGEPQPFGAVMVNEQDNRRTVLVTINEEQLLQSLADSGAQAVVTVAFPNQADAVTGQLTGRIVKALEQYEAVVEFASDLATYRLPAQSLNIDAVARTFGADTPLQDITIRVEIAEPPAAASQWMEQLDKAGDITFVGSPVQFAVRASYGDRTIDVGSFAAYVERRIALPENTGAERVTTGVVIEPDGTLRHVPTQISTIEGKLVAQMNSLTNSTYTLVWKPVSFSDMERHWAKEAVNDMGSRLVVSGVGDGRFAPDQAITRAEFTAILVRGLGLGAMGDAASFTDVKPDAWYTGAIHTAHAYGLIDGYADGTFRPLELVTREQAMVIAARAMQLTGLSSKLIERSGDDVLRGYVDADSVSHWARSGLVDNLRAGLITGRGGGLLAPQAAMTRAEIAVVIRKLLQQSDLI